MEITGLSHLFKWENLHNWWLTKYFLPHCIYTDTHITVVKNIYRHTYTHRERSLTFHTAVVCGVGLPPSDIDRFRYSIDTVGQKSI